MIRFIIKKSFKFDSGYKGQEFYTIDQDVVELERCLMRGGYSESTYERHELMGIEVIE